MDGKIFTPPKFARIPFARIKRIILKQITFTQIALKQIKQIPPARIAFTRFTQIIAISLIFALGGAL